MGQQMGGNLKAFVHDWRRVWRMSGTSVVVEYFIAVSTSKNQPAPEGVGKKVCSVGDALYIDVPFDNNVLVGQ